MQWARCAALGTTVLLATFGLSCGGAASSSSPIPGSGPGPSPSPGPSVVPHFDHVVVVVEENHSYSEIIGSPAMPYLNSLASRYGLATNYFANTHPSIGNYFMLTTGKVITNDDALVGVVPDDNIVRQLVAAGKTWKSYAENLPSSGYLGPDVYPYLKHHNPFAYFSDVVEDPAQAANIVPFTQFASDLASNSLPQYSFVVPNAEHDAHNCPPAVQPCPMGRLLGDADTWLRSHIDPLITNPGFQSSGLLIIVFDESISSDTANGGGQVAMLVISSQAKAGHRSNTFSQHQSTLALNMQALGVTTQLGASAGAPSMAEFF